MGDGQTSRLYRKQRKLYRAACVHRDEPCWLCHQPIDYDLVWPDDQAWELDHLYPRSTHPEYAEDPANFRASHRACNRRRGANDATLVGIGQTSRHWL